MKRTIRCLFLIIPLLILISACNVDSTADESIDVAVQDTPLLPTATDTVEPTISYTSTPAFTPTPEFTPTATFTPTIVVPDEHYIEDIFGYRQFFSLSCEARAAVDWAAYFDVDIYEFDFQHGLPLSDNPDYGFVGSVNGPWGQIPPYAYGVHAGPVADLLQEYGLKAVAYKKYTVEQIREQIAQDHPVIVWVIGNVEGGVPYMYTDPEGREVQVGAYEHVVIVTGYGEDSIRYLNNSRFYDVPVEVFENSWSVLDNMVIVWEE